jgi:threonine aldolase
MTTARYDFASDNVAGAMPEVMAALAAANSGAASGYGADAVSRRAADLIRTELDADAEVRFFASGTAANAFSLAMLAAPHEAVLGHAHSHILTDETGAPGYFGAGVGLIALPGASGRIDPEALSTALQDGDDAHHQSAAALSVTNATEYGAVYSTAAVADLVRRAKAAGLKAQLDGARLANAVAAGFNIKALKDMGLDILVMGGTKVGSAPTEALVILDPALAHRLDARLKHAGQLVSKGRFLAAPWIGMLEDGAWTRRAAHANAMAARLAAGMPFALRHPVEANGVFVEMDAEAYARLSQRGWRVYRVLDGSVRFMCSWATTPTGVDALLEDLNAVSAAA